VKASALLSRLLAMSTVDRLLTPGVFVFSAFALTISCCYVVLVFFSPPSMKTRTSEQRYRCAASLDIPKDLPRLEDTEAAVDLSIVIPAFNEVPRLPVMLKQAVEHLSSPSSRGRTVEIIVVDDGSSDGTSDMALKLAEEHKEFDIRVVSLEKNLGKGGAVRHGMLHARGGRLLMVDADGASQFEDVDKLWLEMDRLSERTDAAVVIGSRAHLVKTDAVVKRSMLRNMAMYALHVVLQLVGVGHIRDTQCGFKLFTRRAAQSIFPYQHLTGWIFDVEILLLAKQQDIPVSEVPINWKEVPESKLNVAKDSLLMFKDLLVLRSNLLSGRWKAPRKKKTIDASEFVSI